MLPRLPGMLDSLSFRYDLPFSSSLFRTVSSPQQAKLHFFCLEMAVDTRPEPKDLCTKEKFGLSVRDQKEGNALTVARGETQRVCTLGHRLLCY